MKTMMSLAALAIATACSANEGGPSANQSAAPGGAAPDRPFAVSEVADFDAPWAMAFLPDGRMLVTEKAGQLLMLSADGTRRVPVSGVPAVDSEGQGGLMDIVAAPTFATDGQVYFSFSESGPGGKGVVLARARLVSDTADSGRLDGVSIIFRASPYVSGGGHYSGRIAFAPDGRHVFFTAGERQKFDPAQDPMATLGKVLRLNLDGTPAADNPLTAQGFHPAVWSYGHRNLLGIAFDGAGNLWQQEMGPAGGDEINLVLPGRNYGYPVVSNGDHYDGRDIPDHGPRDAFTAPKVWWNPAISPAGLIVYSGAMFPAWRGDVFVGALSGKALVRVDVDGTNATKGDQWDMGARIRDVEQGPDGALWLLEDGGRGSAGRLLRLTANP